jgi:hypothetical protein
MFFLIRCVFWLTIVFHAMTWPPETWPPEVWPQGISSQGTWPAEIWPSAQARNTQGAVIKMAADAAGNLSKAAGTALAAKLEGGCSKAPAECLALAAQLPQIVAINQPAQAIDVLPPKRPVHLAESETAHALVTRNPLRAAQLMTR